jgi:hypothetical protein
MPNRLFVVIHGLVSLVYSRKHRNFRALLLRRPGHRMAAGHWLTEVSVPKNATLRLTGVKKGNGALDPATNILLETKRLDEDAVRKYVYAEITLPKPKKAWSFNLMDMAGNIRGKTPKSSSTLAATQVFEYDMTGDFVTLQSATKGEEPFFTSIQDPKVTAFSLHILSEPEVESSDRHVMDEFRVSARLFGADLRLADPVGILRFRERPADFPPEFLDSERLPLYERADAVFKILHGDDGDDAIGGNKVCAGTHGNTGN